jgi:hypothetical protein
MDTNPSTIPESNGSTTVYKSPLTKINKNFNPAYRFQEAGARVKAREIMKKYVLCNDFSIHW